MLGKCYDTVASGSALVTVAHLSYILFFCIGLYEQFVQMTSYAFTSNATDAFYVDKIAYINGMYTKPNIQYPCVDTVYI